MSQATTDPTLEALVPRGSSWRSAGLVLLGLALTAAAWALPPVVWPSVGTNPGGSWQEFAAQKQVLVVAGIEPRTWGGTRVISVHDVPGAHVVAAWATNEDLWGGAGSHPVAPAPSPDTRTPDEVVAEWGLTAADRLPRTVTSDRDATLLVLWQIDDCGALTDVQPEVVVGSRWGVRHTDRLRFSPFQSMPVGQPGTEGPCSP